MTLEPAEIIIIIAGVLFVKSAGSSKEFTSARQKEKNFKLQQQQFHNHCH